MRLSDWCILVAAIGICCIMPLGIRMSNLSEAFCSQQLYSRILDRVCEDSLIDAVDTEQEFGEPQVDVQKVYERFDELLAMEFGAVSAWEKEKLLEGIRFKQFENLAPQLSVQQTEDLRQAWETAIARSGNPGEKEISLYFPYIAGEDWYQNLAGPSLYSYFEPERIPPGDYRRYAFSGSRIVKLAPEAGYGAARSGSSIQQKP